MRDYAFIMMMRITHGWGNAEEIDHTKNIFFESNDWSTSIKAFLILIFRRVRNNFFSARKREGRRASS